MSDPIPEERIECKEGVVIVRPCPAFRVLAAQVHDIAGDIDGLGTALNHYKEQHEALHNRENDEYAKGLRLLSEEMRKGYKEIMDAVKNRLPIWATAAGAGGGMVIGSLITLVVVLYSTR